MAIFVLYCLDKSQSFELRQKTRSEHIEWLRTSQLPIKFAGPLLDAVEGGMIGSLLAVEAPDIDSVKLWAANDPYQKVGLFATIAIHPWRQTLPPQSI
jgi:uncharacterized protein